MSIPIAVWWCEHTTDALAASDKAELVKRHRPSLERLRESLDNLLAGL